MSFTVRTYESDTPEDVLSYAYTRADENEEKVVIFRRIIQTDNLNTAILYEYIATGITSEVPDGAVIFSVINPRSPLYANSKKQGMCC